MRAGRLELKFWNHSGFELAEAVFDGKLTL